MSKQTFEASSIVFNVHGHALQLNPSIGYVHGAIMRPAQGSSVLTIERDDATGQVTIRVDKK